jgi:nucleotide-binding universal stress UspA family protein
MIAIKTILHATDFSEPANVAYQFATALARDYKAKLLIAYVRELPVALTRNPDAFPVEPPEVEDALRKRLYAMRPEDAQMAVEHYLLVGDPAIEILDLAEEKGCDLIVMGTHGRTGLARLFMGSVAEQVLRRARCPVLTVKQPVAGTATKSATA